MKLHCIIIICLCLCTHMYCFTQITSQPDGDMIQVGAPSSCQHTYVNQTFGILTSPYYPLGYPDDTSCKWTIKMVEGTRVVVSIRRFILGPGDRLEVSNGRNDERNFYSLNDPPSDVIYSSGSTLTLLLISARSTNSTKEMMMADLSRNRTFYAIFEVEGCGGVLTESSAYITVPSYIHLSFRSHECVWNVISPKNKVIILNFLQFDLSPGTCLYSKLHIRDGDRKAGYIIGDFCEENPPLHELRTATNVMYISYRTRPNFLAKDNEMVPSIRMYYHIADACGGEFSSFSGSFSTPKRWLDDIYTCNWTINVPHGKQLSLKIYKWKVLNSTDKEYDEMSIFIPNKPPHVWSSKERKKPRRKMVIPSNLVTISLVSHRNRSSVAKLEFYCVYEALQVPIEQCIDAGTKRIFMCDEWNYIDCDRRCNGVMDCDNGKDEDKCIGSRFENEFDMQHDQHKKSVNISIYFTFLFVAICVSLVIVVASFTFNHLYKRSQQNKNSKPAPNTCISQPPYYPNIYPPPYATREQCTVSTFCRPPPPYPYSFDETNLTGDDTSLRLSLVAVSVANQTLNETSASSRSGSTTSTMRLRDLDIPVNRSEYTRSMDTMFMIDECSYEENEDSPRHEEEVIGRFTTCR